MNIGWKQYIRNLDPCDNGGRYLGKCKTFRRAWNNCQEPSWLLWLAALVGYDKRRLRLLGVRIVKDGLNRKLSKLEQEFVRLARHGTEEDRRKGYEVAVKNTRVPYAWAMVLGDIERIWRVAHWRTNLDGLIGVDAKDAREGLSNQIRGCIHGDYIYELLIKKGQA